MSEVICISDSEESCRSTTTNKANNCRESDEETEFDFPAVEFHYEEDEHKEVYSAADKEDEEDDFEEDKHEEDDFEADIPEEYYSKVDKPKEYYSKTDKPKKYYSRADKPNEDDSEVPEPAVRKPANSKKKQNLKNFDSATLQKRQKTLKPDDCLKLIKVCMDENLEKYDFVFHITGALERHDMSWYIDNLPIRNSIRWITRNEYDEEVIQEHILIIWNWDTTVKKVHNNTFEYHLSKLLRLVPNTKPTLILLGMEEYFQAKRTGKSTIRVPRNKGCMSFYDAPKVRREELENDLTLIQQNLNCGCRLIDDPDDLGPLVYRYTKSIAQIPYKKQKRQKLEEKLDWYASGDNRDTVRVDNRGIGLSRLWQQQLCQFTLSSLETAEAIASIYHSPQELIATYMKCTKIEGEKLLKDIPIRRAAGHLSTVRKIGPELSKKIYILFTSKDGKATLGN